MKTLEERVYAAIAHADHPVPTPELARTLRKPLPAVRGACYRLHQRHRALANTAPKGRPAVWAIAPGRSLNFSEARGVEAEMGNWPAPCELQRCWVEKGMAA